MIEIPIQLHYARHRSHDDRKAESTNLGCFMESPHPRDWLSWICQVSEDPNKCDLFPIVLSDRLRGAFVRFNAPLKSERSTDFRLGSAIEMRPYDMPKSTSSCQVWLPICASLSAVPQAVDTSIFEAFSNRLIVWHPAFGVLAIDQGSRQGIESLFTLPVIVRSGWNDAKEASSIPERLLRVDAQPPPAIDRWLQDAIDPVSSPNQELMNLPPSRAEKQGQPIANSVSMIRSVVGKFALRMVDFVVGGEKDARKNEHKEVSRRPLRESEDSHRRSALSNSNWLRDIRSWAREQVNHWSDTIQARRDAAVNRLLEMLEKDSFEGLKFAIPLTSEDAGRGLSRPGYELVERDFRASGSSSGSDHWSIGDSARLRLQNQYLSLARKALIDGRYETAAYIYSKLLGDNIQAAQALEKGKFYRQSAIIYRDLLDFKKKAAEVFCLAGDFEEALLLYTQLGLFIAVGDLHRRLDQMDDAEKAYLTHVANCGVGGRWCEAADVLAEKLGRTDEAVKMLGEHWPEGNQGRACLQKSIELLARENRHQDVIVLIDRLTDHPNITDAYANAWPSDFLASVAVEYSDKDVRTHAQKNLFVHASRMLNVPRNRSLVDAVTASLCKAVPEDRLLHRDALRFKDKANASGTSSAAFVGANTVIPPRKRFELLQPTQAESLSADVEWFGMLPSEGGQVCFGERDKSLVICTALASKSGNQSGNQTVFEVRSFFANADGNRWLRYSGENCLGIESYVAIINGGKCKAEFGGEDNRYRQGGLNIQILPANQNVLDCFLPNGFSPTQNKSTNLDQDCALFLTSQMGTLRLGVMNSARQLSYPFSISKNCFQDFAGAVLKDLDFDLDMAMSENLLHSMLVAHPWRVAKLQKEVLLSFGNRFCVLTKSNTIQTITETQSNVESILVSNRFARPRVILCMETGVMLHWLKYDDYQSCMIDDQATNSRACFLTSGHIVVAHDNGVQVYSNQGMSVKLQLAHESNGGYVSVQGTRDVFWTLTKNGLVQRWEYKA